MSVISEKVETSGVRGKRRSTIFISRGTQNFCENYRSFIMNSELKECFHIVSLEPLRIVSVHPQNIAILTHGAVFS